MKGLHEAASLDSPSPPPHAQSWLLGAVPLGLEQGSPALHLLEAAWQKSPVTSVQVVDGVHLQGASLAAEALVMAQSSAAKQRQYSEA